MAQVLSSTTSAGTYEIHLTRTAHEERTIHSEWIQHDTRNMNVFTQHTIKHFSFLIIFLANCARQFLHTNKMNRKKTHRINEVQVRAWNRERKSRTWNILREKICAMHWEELLAYVDCCDCERKNLLWSSEKLLEEEKNELFLHLQGKNVEGKLEN